MKKFIGIISLITISIGITRAVINNETIADVTVFSSMEEFRTADLKVMLKEKFPKLNIAVTYSPSGTTAAKLRAEGVAIAADMVLDIDYGNLEGLKNYFTDNNGIDSQLFLPELQSKDNLYAPISKYAVGIMVNDEVLKKDNLPVPTSYQDLTNPVYKNNIVMPNPSASGTGFAFYKGMVNYMGEDKALNFFDEFQKNVIQFTSSGSGPVNSLVRGETAIGVGMIFQGVQEINKGSNIRIIDTKEGYAYNASGCALIKKRNISKNVKEVYKYILTEFNMYDKVNYLPEQIFITQDPTTIKDFPALKTLDMSGFQDPQEKERLLKLWKY